MKKLTPLGVRRKIAAIQRRRDDIAKARGQIWRDLCEIQEHCQHVNKTKHRDPSGGNDHAFTCLDCGKEW